MKIVKRNFHSHTHYCKHATHKTEDLVKLAIKHGFEEFAISEHMPIPTNPARNTSIAEVELLIKEFQKAKKVYGDQIKLYFGLECEYHDEMHDLIKTFFDNKNIDFLIFGNHFVGSCLHHFNEHYDVDKLTFLEDHLTNATMAMKSGFFSCYNHPDLFMKTYRQWDQHAMKLTQDMIDLSVKYQIPLEFNLNGLYDKNEYNDEFMYPYKPFWEQVAKSKAPVIIGVDTHSPLTMNNKLWNQGEELIETWGLNKNLVTHIKFQKKQS